MILSGPSLADQERLLESRRPGSRQSVRSTLIGRTDSRAEKARPVLRPHRRTPSQGHARARTSSVEVPGCQAYVTQESFPFSELKTGRGSQPHILHTMVAWPCIPGVHERSKD